MQDHKEFEQALQQALDALRAGRIILYPTDTIWGIGCDATNEAAVQKIYSLKQRADAKSMILLVADEKMLLEYVAAPDPEVFGYLGTIQKPTTIIFHGALHLPGNVVAPDGSVGMRIPKDDFCRHLVKRLQRPLVSTSANISGEPSPASFASISETIKKGVDHIVGWKQDVTNNAAPSRIIRWEGNGKHTVIRD